MRRMIIEGKFKVNGQGIPDVRYADDTVLISDIVNGLTTFSSESSERVRSYHLLVIIFKRANIFESGMAKRG